MRVCRESIFPTFKPAEQTRPLQKLEAESRAMEEFGFSTDRSPLPCAFCRNRDNDNSMINNGLTMHKKTSVSLRQKIVLSNKVVVLTINLTKSWLQSMIILFFNILSSWISTCRINVLF